MFDPVKFPVSCFTIGFSLNDTLFVEDMPCVIESNKKSYKSIKVLIFDHCYFFNYGEDPKFKEIEYIEMFPNLKQIRFQHETGKSFGRLYYILPRLSHKDISFSFIPTEDSHKEYKIGDNRSYSLSTSITLSNVDVIIKNQHVTLY